MPNLFCVRVARNAQQLLALEADDPELLGALGVGLLASCYVGALISDLLSQSTKTSVAGEEEARCRHRRR
jgi:hypothetical protein